MLIAPLPARLLQVAGSEVLHIKLLGMGSSHFNMRIAVLECTL